MRRRRRKFCQWFNQCVWRGIVNNDRNGMKNRVKKDFSLCDDNRIKAIKFTLQPDHILSTNPSATSHDSLSPDKYSMDF